MFNGVKRGKTEWLNLADITFRAKRKGSKKVFLADLSGHEKVLK